MPLTSPTRAEIVAGWQPPLGPAISHGPWNCPACAARGSCVVCWVPPPLPRDDP